MLCLCHYGSALERFWFENDLGREKKTGGEDVLLPWSRVDHTLRPIFKLQWMIFQ